MSLPNPDNRPLLIGPPTGPEAPFPFRMEGEVISGFGRGSKELGIPTANLPVDDENAWIKNIDSGIYFGWASLKLPASHPNSVLYQKPPTSEPVMMDPEKLVDQETGQWQIYPMVMSIGYNPFYKNTVRSAEVHVLGEFAADFYGVGMRLLITGFIRNEKDYSGLEALIADIHFDCEVARHSLARKGWRVRELGVKEGEEEGELDGSWLVR
nr:conserved hypothetical protein [Neurospora crassa]